MPAFTQELTKKLAAHCVHLPNLTGGSKTISHAGVMLVAGYYEVTAIKAMQLCLSQGYWPLRFARNAGVFSATEQSALLSAHVFIAGCGGLGGHAATLLARAGVGAFSLCDGDTFSESNLNRQLLCHEDNLGKNKAEITAAEIAAIASHTQVKVLPFMLDSGNVEAAIAKTNIIIDCLDSLPARTLLLQAAAQKNIPFVHGAIAGHEGFISLVRQGEDTLRVLYGDTPPQKQDCAEYVLGVPTVTPAATAALQVALAMQQLTGQTTATKSVYHLDVLAPLLDIMQL